MLVKAYFLYTSVSWCLVVQSVQKWWEREKDKVEECIRTRISHWSHTHLLYLFHLHELFYPHQRRLYSYTHIFKTYFIKRVLIRKSLHPHEHKNRLEAFTWSHQNLKNSIREGEMQKKINLNTFLNAMANMKIDTSDTGSEVELKVPLEYSGFSRILS